MLLIVVAAVVGAVVEAIMGIKVGADWIGTIIVGLIGAWIGSALFRIGPIIGGVYLISAILGAIILVFLLKMVTGRRTT
ncbi:MAG: GlsB/YeaQ/YmgE family stress response membrane protein [Armatimonadota bacterium]|nr:GlsB/YeaQ/YmgE family stress response membrane protein [Armatimonadota bacterium]